MTPTGHALAADGTARWLTLYQLHRPEVIANPWAYYRRLNEERCYFDPYLRSWLLARHADVTAVLRDRRFSVAMRHRDRIGPLVSADPAMHRALRYLDRHVSFVDPPDHTRLRNVLSASVTRRRVAALDAVITDAVADAVARFTTAKESDIVRDLAVSVPLTVLRHLLGLPDLDLSTLRRWSTAWGDVIGTPGHLPTSGRAGILTTVNDMINTLTDVAANYRRRGRRSHDTVIADLVAASVDGRLDHDELIATLMMLVTAGAETTTNLISIAVLALMNDPDLWDRLSADRTLLPAAVDELARLHPPTQYTARTALVDVDTCGPEIRRGQPVVLMLAAANRDPDVFTQPDAFRIGRAGPGPSVTFGRGPHACPGATLARLEVRRTLDALLSLRRPEPAGEPTWRRNANLRGLATLPVHWPKPCCTPRDRRTP